MRHLTPNLALGLLCLGLAAGVAFLWVPLDVDTGVIERVRRRITVGDALAPTIAAAFIAVGSIMLIAVERGAPDQPRLTKRHLVFLLALLALLMVVFAIMRWAGPLAVWIAGMEADYRALRATAPWKLIGFGLGGFTLVVGLISVLERRISLRAIVIAVAATALLIVLFDLPFDDLLLPPNGDV